MSQTDAIMIQGLHKSYGATYALQGVDLSVGRGEILGFLGPNGAGKTTTIRCLLDLIRPDAGTIRVLGLDPREEPVTVKARVGYLPGELNLEPNMRTGAVLRYLAAHRGSRTDWDYVVGLANTLALDLRLPVKNLSKGNKQKIGVIQALMARPEVLMLDEPTSGLDPLMQQEVYRLLRAARNDGATVFFSSHIVSEVEALADRVAIIRSGRIADIVDPHHLTELSLRRLYVRFHSTVQAGALQDIPGVVTATQEGDNEVTLQVQGDMDGLIKGLAALPVLSLESERPSLEEQFLALYHDEHKGSR